MNPRRSRLLPLETLAPYLLALPDPPAPLDFAAVFGNALPVQLEVGFGKGAFLLAAAEAGLGCNWLGIEKERKLQLYAATRLAKRNLSGVRVVCGDAGALLAGGVRPGALAAIHVYFPDPWWKKRHKKRRVFAETFAVDAAKALEPGGWLHLASDVEEYFGLMCGLVTGCSPLRPPAPDEPLPAVPKAVTNFEQKAIEEGRAIWRASFRKPS